MLSLTTLIAAPMNSRTCPSRPRRTSKSALVRLSTPNSSSWQHEPHCTYHNDVCTSIGIDTLEMFFPAATAMRLRCKHSSCWPYRI